MVRTKLRLRKKEILLRFQEKLEIEEIRKLCLELVEINERLEEIGDIQDSVS